jgi:hypothetical protein
VGFVRGALTESENQSLRARAEKSAAQALGGKLDTKITYLHNKTVQTTKPSTTH